MLYIALIALVASIFGACTNEFEPGQPVTGPQVSFLPNNPSSLEFTGNTEENAQKLTLVRTEKEEELEVFILVDMDNSAKGCFTIPETVTFAAGEATAELEYTVHQERFANDKAYKVNFIIADEEVSTPYGYAEWTVNFSLNPWELVKDSNGNNAKGKFRGGDAITGLLKIDPTVEIDVDIYKHKSIAGLYKIADPWTLTIVGGFGYASVAEAEKDDWKFSHADLVIDASNPSQVVIAEQEIGADLGLGPIYVFTGYPDYFDAAQGAGVLEDGVITFPVKGTFMYMPGYNAESIYYGNNNGLLRIIFPGVEIADYSLAVAYDGMDVAADNKTTTAKFKFTYGDDVTGIKYMIVNGDVESDPTEALTTLFAGEDKNIKSVEDFKQGGKEVGIKSELTQGIYSIVAVPVDKSGALRTKEAIVKSFYFAGMGVAEEHPCEIGVIATKFSVAYPDYASLYPDTEALAFCIYGTEIKDVKFIYLPTAKLNELLAEEGVTLEGIITENNFNDGENYSVDLTKVNSDNGWTSSAIGLDDGIEYTIAVLGQNIYGETATATVAHTTDALPEYTGELKIGQYYMVCEAPTQSGSKKFENVFTVEPTSEENVFFVSDFGLNDGGKYKWYATYDSAAATLTIDGIMKGLEQNGSILGRGLYGQVDSYLYGTFCQNSDESDGSDPIVLGVDPTTKQIKSLNNGLVEIAAFDSDYNYLGFLAIFYGEITTITPYTEAATASVMSAPALTKAPFSSIVIDRTAINSVSKLSNIKARGAIKVAKASGVRTVELSNVEQYTPAKVKGFTKVKANAAAIRR